MRPFPDNPYGTRVTDEQAEIDRQVSQDGSVAVTFSPVELVGNVPHRQVQGDTEEAEKDQEDFRSHRPEVNLKVRFHCNIGFPSIAVINTKTRTYSP